ncbi:MAG: hypothetical protein JSS86_13585 [Cyanobacteria bacterium SZAS LIN-2]|nr:hypothetical protein [Cyanobacteria bacterium SZAS LIN-2]MBS2010338.1 hypothetical protein [Cyanobacteria bacterium SZAS TMP-1]
MQQDDGAKKLSGVINRMRATLDSMHQDDRYSKDDEFFEAAEKLDANTQKLSETLRQADSEFFSVRREQLGQIANDLQPELEKIDAFMAGTTEGIKLLTVVEQVAKIIHPLL